MTREELLETVNRCLSKVLESDVRVTEETHLTDDEILDSLDAATFAFEVEAATKKKMPDSDLEEYDLYKVSKLLDYLSD